LINYGAPAGERGRAERRAVVVVAAVEEKWGGMMGVVVGGMDVCMDVYVDGGTVACSSYSQDMPGLLLYILSGEPQVTVALAAAAEAAAGTSPPAVVGLPWAGTTTP